ncbi:MAG TPA: hypothetical protein VMZ29_09805 [Candidatus Bathyarchaeia archaeon]|nr:hypothetical protein [Candidatus Bathyarchaeia archaeon]
MWKMLISIIFSILLLSCSHVHVQVDPKTGIWTADYWRLGNQAMNGLEISKKGGDVIVGLDSQKATDESLQEILKIVRQLAIVP